MEPIELYISEQLPAETIKSEILTNHVTAITTAEF